MKDNALQSRAFLFANVIGNNFGLYDNVCH
jgi:hypothetical protein